MTVIGLEICQIGRPMRGKGGFVSNHTTWLDIFVLNSRAPLYFVAKQEVSEWPGVGFMARVAGTLFVKRDRREAARQAKMLEAALRDGARLLIFPEGTSTDGLRVLPFKATLLASFLAETLRHDLSLQAISTTYKAPDGQEASFYGWWGDMDFGPSLLRVLGQRHQGLVTVTFHEPVPVDSHPNRKTLSARVEAQVREGFDAALSKG